MGTNANKWVKNFFFAGHCLKWHKEGGEYNINNTGEKYLFLKW